jgi:ABC-type glutathione transport system ATPase component
VGILYAGRLCEVAPAKVLFGAPQHPYTRGLMNLFRTSTVPSGGKKGLGDRRRTCVSLHPAAAFIRVATTASEVCANTIPPLISLASAADSVPSRNAVGRRGGMNQREASRSVPVLNVQNLKKEFAVGGGFKQRQLRALNEVSFELFAAEVIALVANRKRQKHYFEDSFAPRAAHQWPNLFSR